MSDYSSYKLGDVDLETDKAYLAKIENFTDIDIWIPKSVVGPERRIKKWFIRQKEKELKNFTRKKEQSALDQFFEF